MEKWQKGLVLDEGARAAKAHAENVAERTRELLVSQGWCLWKCSVLGGEIIAVVLDENMEGVPEGYPTYTEAELEELCQNDVSEAALRLVYETKKAAGAVVISAEDVKG
jgi:hypothetical protein